MEYIYLSFQSAGNNKYRFGISTNDSLKFFRERNKNVVIKYKDEILFAKTTCGKFVQIKDNNTLKLEKGFDLYSKEISNFIKSNLHINSEVINGIECYILKKSNFTLITIKSFKTKDDKEIPVT